MFPTPNVPNGVRSVAHKVQLCLEAAVRLFPTPQTHNAQGAPGQTRDDRLNDLCTTVAGMLNPDWVEWLMGWPIGWTTLAPLPPAAVADWLARGHPLGDWWADEHELPRITSVSGARRARLTALGNGQVPACAARAWCLLTLH